MDQYEALVSDFHALRTRDANARIYLGVDERLDELPDPSLVAARREVRDAQALLQRVRQLPDARLSFDQALDRDLMVLLLEARIHDESYLFNGRTTREQLPLAADGISGGIFSLFSNDPRPAGDRLADIAGRIEAVPEYLEAMYERLDTPVARWRAIELDKLAGLPELWQNIERWAADQQWSDLPRLQRASQAAQQALDGYAQRLRRLPTTPHLHLDPADARKLVQLRGVEPSFEDMHAMARQFLADTTAELQTLRQRLVGKYRLAADTTAAQLQQFLNRQFATAPTGPLEAILERYQQEHERVLAFIEERQLFPIPADQDIKILRTPGFLAPSIPAGAMEPPPPFREGTRISLVYLTLSEELRDAHTELGIPAMMIHEGIPGHHLQLASASLHPSVVRRHVSANEHAEGWTTMLEDYMLDQGYMGELTDEARFCGKRDLARIGARVAIDLYFMTGERGYLDVGVACGIEPDDDAFTAAGRLLAEVTGFGHGHVQAELNWYSQARGYPLCYLTGNRLVWQLKADMARHRPELPATDLDRLFHETYLQSGNMPLSFLRRVLAHRGLIAV